MKTKLKIKPVRCEICKYLIKNPQSRESEIYINKMKVHEKCYNLFKYYTKTEPRRNNRTDKQITLFIKKIIHRIKNE